MKKTINVSLGGINFTLEEDAYERLDQYLKEVRSHFASYKEADEIVADIEARFAEQFSGKVGGTQAITLPEIEKVIASMGSPEQFGDQPASPGDGQGGPSPSLPAADRTHKTGRKRLYRDSEDVIIAGVCSGLAAYIGIDPVWVRLVFVLSVFAGGTGALIYILLWIIVPEAKTDTEKMEMRGEPITLKNLEQTIKDKAEDVKKNGGKIKEVAGTPVRALGKVVRALALAFAKLFKALVKVIGLAVIAAGMFGAAILVFVTVTALFNSNSPYVDLPLSALAHNSLYYLGIVAAFVTILLPLVALIILGVSIASSKSAFNKIAGFSLLGVWIVAAAAAVNIGIRLAPQVEAAINDNPQYQVAIKNLDLKDFSKIDLSGADIADITPGDTFKITVEGRQHDLDNTEFKVENGTLTDTYHKTRICVFCINHPLHLTITAPKLDGVSGSGGTKIQASDFESDNFHVNLSGASQATLDLKAANILADLSGASRLILTGTSTTLNVKESGASRIEADQAKLSKATIDLSGASRIWLGDVITLTTSASGASKVYYRSAKTLEEVEISGASKVQPVNSSTPTPPSPPSPDEEYIE